MIQDYVPLPREFYLQPALEAARALIGALLVMPDGDSALVGRIVETEAYTADDPSSHSFRGRTPRNASMFGPPGHAYVYLIYGYHYCLNLVTPPAGTADAVLIRALEPLQGLETMRTRRAVSDDRLLLSGPARLCQAFGIDRSFDGEDVTGGGRLVVARGDRNEGSIGERTRVGLSHETASQLPWRFVEEGSRYLSKS